MKSRIISTTALTLLAFGATDVGNWSQLSFVGSPAQAVIGRPLTPLSGAGVARRTVRRGAYYGGAAVAVGAATVATTAAVASARLMTLPAGCMNSLYSGITYYNCSGVYYQQAYDGPDVVYVQTNPPG